MTTMAELFAQHRAKTFQRETQHNKYMASMAPPQEPEPLTKKDIKKQQKEKKEEINGSMSEIIEQIIDEKPTPARVKEALRNYVALLMEEELF